MAELSKKVFGADLYHRVLGFFFYFGVTELQTLKEYLYMASSKT